MKKQDDLIKQLFDNYADELTPRDDLSSAARYEMTAMSEQRKPSASTRKNNGFVRHLGWLIPVSFVVLFVSVLLVFLPVLGLNDDPNSGNHNTQLPTTETVYTFADVKGRRVTLDDCDDILQISRLVEADYEIVSERYYAFYTESGELRYVKALLGVRNSNGFFTEIEIIAEVDGFVRKDLKSTYDMYSRYDGMVSDSGYADNGEYVTQAYFAARNMHFYVVAQSGQASTVAREIISALTD